MRPEEIPHLHIEISRLTPLERSAPEAIVVGRDGIVMEHGDQRGLLLPQVAVEYGCDREAFLEMAREKAGIDPRVPMEAVTVHRFTAEVFAE